MKFTDLVTQKMKLSEALPVDEAAAIAQGLNKKPDEIQFIRKFYVAEKTEDDADDSDKKGRSVIAYISTKEQDRDGEVIEVSIA